MKENPWRILNLSLEVNFREWWKAEHRCKFSPIPAQIMWEMKYQRTGGYETLELGCMDFLQIRSPGFLHAHIHPRKLIFDHFRYYFLIIKPLKLTMGQKCGRDTIFYSQNYPIFQLGTQLMYIFQPWCIYFRVMQLHSNKWYVDKKWSHKNLFCVILSPHSGLILWVIYRR